jgi:hypothetical protein
MLRLKNGIKKIRSAIDNEKGDSLVYILLAVVCAMFVIIVGLVVFIYMSTGSSLKDKIREKAIEVLEGETEEETEQTTDPVVSYVYSEPATEETTEEVTEAQTQAEENVHGSVSLDNSGGGSSSGSSSSSSSSSAQVNANMTSIMTDLMYGYGNALCTAINAGDYSIVAPYIQSGSALETMQRSLVSNLYSKGTTESFEWATVKQVVMNNSGVSCTLYVDECETINSYSKGTYTKSFSWTYTAYCDNGVWRLSNLK